MDGIIAFIQMLVVVPYSIFFFGSVYVLYMEMCVVCK